MFLYISYYTYYVILLLSLLIGTYKYKITDLSGKIIYFLILSGFITQTSVMFISKSHERNLIFSVDVVIDFFLLMLYFYRAIKVQNIRLVSILTVAALAIISYINSFFLPTPS